MNFLGMGVQEMGVIFLIAFLALGPSKFIETTRTMGRVVRNLQKVFQEVVSAVNLEQEENSGSRRSASPPPNTERDAESGDRT